MSYTPEEKELLKAARLLNTNCNRRESCEGCIFDTEDVCAISGFCGEWDLLTEEEEEY